MRKSSESKSGFPNMETCRSVCPSDSEQNAPMTQVITVTSVAPRLRDMLNSSRRTPCTLVERYERGESRER